MSEQPDQCSQLDHTRDQRLPCVAVQSTGHAERHDQWRQDEQEDPKEVRTVRECELVVAFGFKIPRSVVRCPGAG